MTCQTEAASRDVEIKSFNTSMALYHASMVYLNADEVPFHFHILCISNLTTEIISFEAICARKLSYVCNKISIRTL